MAKAQAYQWWGGRPEVRPPEALMVGLSSHVWIIEKFPSWWAKSYDEEQSFSFYTVESVKSEKAEMVQNKHQQNHAHLVLTR